MDLSNFKIIISKTLQVVETDFCNNILMKDSVRKRLFGLGEK